MRIQGIYTKTISIELSTNVYSYAFASQNKFIGMPPDATILAIWVRVPQKYPTDKDVKGKVLSQVAIPRGNINLKSKDGDNILQSIPLAAISSRNLIPFQQTFFQPIKNNCIDWLGSTIQISTSSEAVTVIVDKEVVEFTIHYTMDCDFNFKKYMQEYESGVNLLGVRSGLLSVYTENTTPATFELSKNSSISLPNEATLVGYSPIEIANVRDPQNRPLANQNARITSFLSLQYSQTLVLDAIPITHLFTPYLGLPYFPLPAMPVGEMDWEASKIYSSDPATIQTGEAFMFMIYYVCKDPL